MSVLNPMLLWFLPLVAAPFILHLLSKRRLPVIDLPTFRFLVDSYERQHRRSQLLEWLLLLLRTLFVLFCIFLIARPIANQWAGLFGSTDSRPVVLLVDTSASLQYQELGASVLDRAKQAARAVVAELGANDKVTLLRVGGSGSGGVEVLARDFSAHSPALTQRIDSLTPSLGEANILGGLRQAHTLLAERLQEGSRVYIVSDLQKTNWQPVLEEGAALLGENGSIVLVRVGSSDIPANVAVIGSPPDGTYPVVGLPMTLQPRVKNFGSSDADVTVEVIVDNVQIDRFTHRLAPGETLERTVSYTPQREGMLEGRFRCTGDTFALDDEYLFALNVGGPLKVLLVNGQPSGDPLHNELFYLKTALETRGRDLAKARAASSPNNPSLAKGFEAPSMQIREENDGNWNPGHLNWADVVILANCSNYGDQRVQWMRDYVEAGGGLIMFPGHRSGSDSQRKLLASPGRNLPPLLSVLVGQSDGGTMQQPQLHQRLAAMDLGNPVCAPFAPPEDQKGSATSPFWQSPRFYRWFLIALDEDPTRKTKTQILARFGNTLPALVEGEFGRGRVLLAAFPATTQWNNLPLKSEFVPLILQMVSAVRRRPMLEVPSAVAVGSPVWISLPSLLREVKVEVFPPSVEPPADASVASEGTPVEMILQENTRTGRFDGTSDKGFYRVRAEGQEGTAKTPGETRRAEAGFAVNVAPAESDLRDMDFDILATAIGPDRISLADLSGTETTVEEAVSHRWEMWRLLTYVLFAIFFAEFLIATARGPQKDQPARNFNWRHTMRSWLGGDHSSA